MQPYSFNLGGRKVTDHGIADEIRHISSEFKAVPVVILADTEDLAQILTALECGHAATFDFGRDRCVCVEAINLAAAGGIFVPASSVLSMRHLINSGSCDTRPLTGMFTLRQAEVAQALRRGKANKIIAYELNLRESTVKVHIRNIMKKLKATNRTEVAYKVNDLFAEELWPKSNRKQQGGPPWVNPGGSYLPYYRPFSEGRWISVAANSTGSRLRYDPAPMRFVAPNS